MNRPIGDDQCKYCGKKGHWAPECHKKRNEVAHVAQAKEGQEPMLTLATAKVNAASSSQPLPPTSPLTPVESALIHLEENKLFIRLGDGHEGEST